MGRDEDRVENTRLGVIIRILFFALKNNMNSVKIFSRECGVTRFHLCFVKNILIAMWRIARDDRLW